MTLLIISQVYVPDPASLGQHLADVAEETARRGERVVVLCADHGYDDPTARYPRRETRNGVSIRRLPWSSFGKRSLATRLAGALAFLAQALLRGLLTRDLRRILVSTSPPMAGALGAALAALRRVPFSYWVMDVNPDQAIALGKVRPTSLAARLFERMNRVVLRRASRVIAMDRAMEVRLTAKQAVGDRLAVIPPWPHEQALEPVPAASNPFRAEHGLGDRFVFMYSGNHGPSHPITTLLRAALRLEDRADVLFLFVGGGSGKADVEAAIAAGARNVRSLPYQPFERIRFSLSAADVHLATFGAGMAGIVHPSKVYAALAIGRPVLLVGPADSPPAAVVRRHDCGFLADHGDEEELAGLMRRIAATDRATLAAMGARGRDAARTELGKEVLCGRLCDLLESATD